MVEGEDCVGGLIGCNTEGAIFRSYATGSVVGVSFVGGLIWLDHMSLVKPVLHLVQ